MTQHINLSLEQLIKTALDGEELNYSTMVEGGDGVERKDIKIHFDEDPQEVRRLLCDDMAFAMRKYPELRMMSAAVHNIEGGE